MADDRARGDLRFADVLGQAIQDRALALDRIAARLRRAGVPVSVATLSYWQTGRSRPTRSRSIRAVEELERILDVPAGTLISALPRDYSVDPIGLLPGSADTKQILLERAHAINRDWTRISIHDTMRVRADRTEASTLTRLVMRAEADNVASWPIVFYQDSETDETPSVDAVSSCTVGESYQIADQNVMLVTMLLPRALKRGEMAMVEYNVTWANTTEQSYRIERSTTATLRSLVLDVQFDGEKPERLSSYRRDVIDDEAKNQVKRVRMLGQGAQHILTDVPPGVHGMTWTWGPPQPPKTPDEPQAD